MTPSNNGKPETPGIGPTVTVTIVIVMLVGVLSALDLSLARAERTETQSEAAGLFQEGSAALQQGHGADAVDLLRRAHAMVRGNQQYQLELVASLLEAHKLDEAGKEVDELLQADPNSGYANLLAARLMVQENHLSDAESHYHRAIYGSWSDNAVEHRLQTRLELADLLAAHRQERELLAELLVLEAEAQKDAAVHKRVANLYLVASSPNRAAAAFRDLLHTNPSDADSYAGLGQAELALGDYRSAWNAFHSADRYHPGAGDVQALKDLANTMTLLDPTPRSLSSADKFERSTRILTLVRGSLTFCVAGRPLPDDVAPLDAQAVKLLAKKQPAHVTNELAEERLTLAQQLWQARVKLCGEGTVPEQRPLRLIMAKLAQ